MSNVCLTASRPGRAATKLFWISVCILAYRVVASGQNPLDDVHVTSRTQTMARPNLMDWRTLLPAPRTFIQKSVDLVLVPVSVTDPMQRLVTGLGRDNFEVFEGNKKQEIKHFSSEDTPVSLGIIVDTSGSMAGKAERVQEAVKQFCDTANAQDEFFMITFSNEPRLAQDFTDSPDDLENELLFTTPKGRTALLDAIYMGIRKMRDARYNRKALLVISDGGDNHSRYTERELKSAVQESAVMIYAIGIFDRTVPTLEEEQGPELLSDVSEITGGRAFVLENLMEMPVLARRIGIELRTQYLLGYRPESLPHDGKWHKISVKLRLPKGLSFLQSHAKKGFYARND